MRKKLKSEGSNRSNDPQLIKIEEAIKRKTNRPLPEDNVYLHKKLDTYRQIFKYAPEKFKAIKLGLG